MFLKCGVGSEHLDVAGNPNRSRVENMIMDGVRLRDAIRCHAKDPLCQSNNLSEFQQAANLGNPTSLYALITRRGWNAGGPCYPV